MSGKGEAREEIFRAVMNDEEQYPVWPAGRDLPAGWREAGTTGTRGECPAGIESVWTDMRPLSLRLAALAGTAA